jgi:hypothetical protein
VPIQPIFCVFFDMTKLSRYENIRSKRLRGALAGPRQNRQSLPARRACLRLPFKPPYPAGQSGRLHQDLETPMSAARNPLRQNAEPISWNFNLLAQNDLGGFGGMGEGIAVQLAKDGRRIAWLAHESAPKNFTAVDVTDPRHPKVVVQTELPHREMRSNSLDVSGDIMAVAYQTQKKGMQPAGLELFDISVPEKPRSISFFDCSGEHSRGVHQLWFCDGE